MKRLQHTASSVRTRGAVAALPAKCDGSQDVDAGWAVPTSSQANVVGTAHPTIWWSKPVVAPAGVTLSEVLVSMLIMSVGVVSLATLFPISVLRTAQATQLTHSVFLRNNAEAAVESNLGLLSNSQIYGLSVSAVVSPPAGYKLAVVDPIGIQLGLPTTLGGVTRTSGGTVSIAQADQLATLPDSWSLVREEAVTATNLGGSPPTITVGNSTSGLYVRNYYVATPANMLTTSNTSQALHRMVMFDATGKFAVVQPLYQITGLNLSWWNVNAGGTSLTTGPSLPTGFTPTRVRIESQERRYTWMMTVRKRWVPSGPITGADGGPGVSGTDDDGVNGTDDNGELHYSGSDDDPNWAAELDVAVFYNRSFRAADETAYSLTFPVNLNVAGDLTTGSWTGFDGQPGVSGVDDDNSGGPPDVGTGESGFPGSDDNRTVMVTFVAGSKPYLKKGGYMLEPSQLKWYRILDLKDVSSLASNTQTVVLLDQNLRYPPTTAATVPTIPTVGGISGVFMRGIIEVYSLGSRTGQQ